eukprot:5705467-Pyramimonas_sp.AAC.1
MVLALLLQSVSSFGPRVSLDDGPADSPPPPSPPPSSLPPPPPPPPYPYPPPCHPRSLANPSRLLHFLPGPSP